MQSLISKRRAPEAGPAVRPGRRELLLASAGLLLGGGTVFAADEALLGIRNGDRERVLGRAELEALPQYSFTTSTIWTMGRPTFSGPPLISVLELAGITSGAVELTAMNDYRTTLSLADLGAHVPILATRIDGKTFSRREKGPLWLVYPYDEDPAFRSEAVYARSVWHLVSIQAAMA